MQGQHTLQGSPTTGSPRYKPLPNTSGHHLSSTSDVPHVGIEDVWNVGVSKPLPKTNGHLLSSAMRLPLVLAVRRDGKPWLDHPAGGARQTGDRFFRLAATADEYLHCRLPEAVLVPSIAGGGLATHAAAWRLVAAAGSAPYALIVERGALLATTLRESISKFLEELHARPGWRVVHLLAAVQPLLAGAPPSSLLRAAPAEGAGAVAYLLSRHGAQVALEQLRHDAGGGDDEALYRVLTLDVPPASSGSSAPRLGSHGWRAHSYASAKAIAQHGLVPRDGSGGDGGGSGPPARSQRELITRLATAGAFVAADGAQVKPAVATMLALDRALFAPGVAADEAYAEAAVHLEHTVMSAPASHARACAALWPALDRAGARALDVGSGSGYLAACFALMVGMGGGGDGALVVALEPTYELAQRAAEAASAVVGGVAQTAIRTCAELIRPVAADGRDGYAALAPYDAIHLGGSCPTIPAALTAQLRPRGPRSAGGRLLLCVGAADEPQDLTLVERVDDGTAAAPQLRKTLLQRGSMMYGLKGRDG